MDQAREDVGAAGSRVLVTGGSSGIGLACARALERGGARVALLARGEDGLAAAARELPAGAHIQAADVGDAAATAAAVDAAAAALGGLDAVIVNAGAAAYGPFREMERDDYRSTLDTTLLGAVNTAHAALPHLERSAGTLVFVGSIAGRVAVPWLAAYTAAKHGVRGFARALSAELRAQDVPVDVALVAPGPVDTPFWRRARTTDRRLPPELRGAYRADDVAAEVLRALRDPRGERTVGGAMAAWALADALAPNLALRATGGAAKLGWRRRERRPRSEDDVFDEPVRDPHVGGGLANRPSLLVRLRDRLGGRA